VIYRGTKKQVIAARRLIEGLVQRAKDEEKAKGAPLSSGMGILGRGPAGEAQDKDGREPPPWRRPRADEAIGNWKRERAPEAAKAGSLTADPSLSMRPAWMTKGKSSSEDAGQGSPEVTIWDENKYSRGLLLQARLKILRHKAYEVPAEMMTMTTGLRPKYKPDKKEKSDVSEAPLGSDGREPSAKKDYASKDIEGSPLIEPSVSQSSPPPAMDLEETATEPRNETGGVASEVPSAYENLPGDSKDILKLKKKLREICKIEEAICAGEAVEPNRMDKVLKKATYEEELKFLEEIVHANN